MAAVLNVAMFAQYAGSAACKTCHSSIYDRWSKTRMANVITDVKLHPEAIIPDLSKPDPLLTFAKEDIAFTYGSKWKQRYFKKIGDDYCPLPAQWDVNNQVWRAYNAKPGTDWWTAHYPLDNMQRPTGPLCDGCHSVNYNARTKAVTEWNVGCEKCHGPGAAHTRKPLRATIVNPARQSSLQANDACIQCHSQGRPLVNPVAGRYYDWPVGFDVTKRLSDFWQLEEHKAGETTFTHFADGTGHKNRMQGNDFVQSLMYRRGVTCFSCHDPHGTANNADLIKPSRDLCLTCHGPTSPNGPHTATLEAHTHHRPESAGSQCVACHMPQNAQEMADLNVRNHTFNFTTPTLTDQFKIPNPCTSCHTDRSTQWARETLKSWGNVSPWRVE